MADMDCGRTQQRLVRFCGSQDVLRRIGLAHRRCQRMRHSFLVLWQNLPGLGRQTRYRKTPDATVIAVAELCCQKLDTNYLRCGLWVGYLERSTPVWAKWIIVCIC